MRPDMGLSASSLLLLVLLLQVFFSALVTASTSPVKAAPTLRVNLSSPMHVFVYWDNTSAWALEVNATVTVKASEINNFPPDSTDRAHGAAADGVLMMKLPKSAFLNVFYFTMGVASDNTPSAFSPITGKWVVAGDCDDFLNVDGMSNPFDADGPWACGECPEGASCEYADTDADVKVRFAYQRVDKRIRSTSSLPFDKSFHKCRVPDACLGMRTPKSEIPVDLYRGRLFLNESTLELGPSVDLARQNIDPSRCNFEMGYVDSLLCERCGTGYVKLTSTNRCDRCGLKQDKLNLLIGIGTTIGVFLFLMIASRIRSSARREYRWHSSIKRICITHIQILSYIMALNVPWPEFMLLVFYFFTAVVSNSAPMAASECLLQSDGKFAGVAIDGGELADFAPGIKVNNFFAISLIVLVLAPILIVVPVNVVYWIIIAPFSRVFSCGRPTRIATCGRKKNADGTEIPDKCTLCCRSCCERCKCPGCCKRRCEPRKINFSKYYPSTVDTCVASTVMVLYTILPSIWRICFTALMSYRIGDDVFVSYDLEQRWMEGDHFLLVVCAVIPSMIMYMLLLPAIMMMKLKRADRSEEEASSITQFKRRERVRFRFGFLYLGYREDRWWWEGVQFLKKICVVLIVTFMDSEFQIHMACGLFILVLHIQHRYDPYGPDYIEVPGRSSGEEAEKIEVRGRYVQMLDSTSVMILLGTMWSAVFFYFRLCSSGVEGEYACHALSGLNLFFNCGIVLYLTLIAIYTQFQRVHETIIRARNSYRASRGNSMSSNRARSTSVLDNDSSIVVGDNPLTGTGGGVSMEQKSARDARQAELEMTATGSHGLMPQVNPMKSNGKKERSTGRGHGRSQTGGGGLDGVGKSAGIRKSRLARLGRGRARHSRNVSAPPPSSAALPEGWKDLKTEDGRTYFQKPDGSATWELPPPPPNASNGPPPPPPGAGAGPPNIPGPPGLPGPPK